MVYGFLGHFVLVNPKIQDKMKEVIDVMELQREKSRKITIDYKQLEFNNGFTPARFIFECGMKLNGQPLTLATAAVIMHRFFREVEPTNYDCFVSDYI